MLLDLTHSAGDEFLHLRKKKYILFSFTLFSLVLVKAIKTPGAGLMRKQKMHSRKLQKALLERHGGEFKVRRAFLKIHKIACFHVCLKGIEFSSGAACSLSSNYK